MCGSDGTFVRSQCAGNTDRRLYGRHGWVYQILLYPVSYLRDLRTHHGRVRRSLFHRQLAGDVYKRQVVLFAGITGDNNPIHTDRTYAESLPFKSRIAHGLLGAGIATGLWGRMGLVDGSAIAALSTEWKFVGAIKIGDTIHCEVEVLEAKQSKSKPDRGVLNIQYTICLLYTSRCV